MLTTANALFALVIFASAIALAAADPPGKAVFVAQSCSECHSVSTAAIKGGDAPDLAGVGARHPAEWIGRFLMKQEDLNGKKHKKKFAGTPAELGELVTWLSSLK